MPAGLVTSLMLDLPSQGWVCKTQGLRTYQRWERERAYIQLDTLGAGITAFDACNGGDRTVLLRGSRDCPLPESDVLEALRLTHLAVLL